MGKSLKCCTQTWRLIFILLNVLFTLIGLILIGIGIWLFVEDTDFDFITDSLYASPASLLIVAGVITTVIAIVGIVGAIGMWYCVLIVYISFMVIVVILQIIAGSLAAVFSDDLRDITEDRVFDAIDEFSNTSSDSEFNRFINFIQREFECCGYNGPGDWVNSSFFEDSGDFPESCECEFDNNCDKCAPFGMPCNDSRPNNSSLTFIWQEGCDSKLRDELKDNLAIAAGLGVTVGVFELSGVAIAFALCICACMKRNKDDDDYAVDEYVY